MYKCAMMIQKLSTLQLVSFDHNKLEIVNIADTSDVSKLGLKFTPKFVRKGDTQAIADGYVNVRI